jgi:AcrR family transcriptional regulator
VADQEVSDQRRRWRGIEPDDRIAARRERLINTAIELLGTDGLAATTVRSVCGRAGLHSRYFYESFVGIDELLVAVFDRVSAAFLSSVVGVTEAAGSDPRARLETAVTQVTTLIANQTSLFRILAVEAIGNEQLNRRRIQMLHDIAASMEQDAYRLYGSPPPGEPIGTLSARFLAAGLAETLVAWVEGDIGGSAEQLASDVAELMMAVSECARDLANRRPTRASKRP